MGWMTLAAIYFTVWWVVLFAVLPFGVRRQENPEAGTEPGAPERPQLVRKFIWTTVVSAVVVGSFWSLFAFGILDWRALVGAD